MVGYCARLGLSDGRSGPGLGQRLEAAGKAHLITGKPLNGSEPPIGLHRFLPLQLDLHHCLRR